LAASLRRFFFGYPLSWEEQSILFSELPAHLQIMAMFKVNTGCREQEVCKLQWDWEIAVPELGTSVFLIPAGFGVWLCQMHRQRGALQLQRLR